MVARGEAVESAREWKCWVRLHLSVDVDLCVSLVDVNCQSSIHLHVDAVQINPDPSHTIKEI